MFENMDKSIMRYSENMKYNGDIKNTNKETAILNEKTKASNIEIEKSNRKREETAQETVNSKEKVRESNEDTREFNKEVRESNEDTREFNKDAREFNKDASEFNNEVEESEQEARESNKEVSSSNKAKRASIKETSDAKEAQNEQIADMGQVLMDGNSSRYKVELLSIIGEVEGHESAPSQNKTTKYEHILPKLALMEDNKDVDGLLILLNTVGGDVEAGLAIAEMIASLSIPTVSLVLGGGHSIGVPMAVSADYSFIVPSATMVIHPVRTNGMFIGVAQSYRNILRIQDRISGFVSRHSGMTQERFEELLLDNSQLVKDVGTMLGGEDAVKEGLINEIGGMKEALSKLYDLIDKSKN